VPCHIKQTKLDMSFISIEFVALLSCCFLTFHLTRNNYRKYILLLGSSLFIGYYHITFLVIAFLITLFTFYWGKIIQNAKNEKKAQLIHLVGIGALVGCWIAFRYAGKVINDTNWLIPLGISFYTFQAIAYLTEVYWKEEKAESSLVDFTLYMLLFMKFLSGPIERSADLLPQLKKIETPSYETIVYGLKLITIGLIKKLIIADRIAPYTSNIFSTAESASGAQLLATWLLYPIELYTDFSGYTDMAIGVAMLFGIQLFPNFNRPFVAQTITDLWRRWHLSLSFWVRDYLYMPLTSATRQWGQWGIYVSLLLTFTALGIWHGAGWNFVVYGLIQGFVIIYELKTQTLRTQIKDKVGSFFYSFYFILRTYTIFALSLLFFRTNSIKDALYFINHISFQTHNNLKELKIGMSDHECIIAGSAIFLILVYEYFMSKKDLLKMLAHQPALVRWIIYYLLLFALLTFGKFNTENFIYLQF